MYFLSQTCDLEVDALKFNSVRSESYELRAL
jgi:hypothetical protein